VPILEKASSRCLRLGDFLAVLLLLVAIAGGGWLWWHEKHPPEKLPGNSPKISQSKPPVAKPAVKPLETNLVSSGAFPPAVPSVKPQTNLPVVKQLKPVAVIAAVPTGFPRPVRDVFEAQVALARRGISPGSLDGAMGSQTRAAIAAFQRLQKLPETAALDTNTRPVLTLGALVLTNYIVTTNDLARLQSLGKTWLAKSQQTAMDYETILELVAEKVHAHPALIKRLNPGINWTNVVPDAVLSVPAVGYPEPDEQAAFVVIHLGEKYLEAFGAETNLLLHCPCSIAAKVEKRPVGSLKVAVVAPNPNYTFDPAVFPESPEAQALGRKLILQPGPNNPVGLAWIGLDRSGYGMHGTPAPEQVGRTESHGCFRLANWDAEYLLKLVWVGMPVEVVP
jgi:lipoprotein-anchoring transpeptidase ErfK/SrfK